MGDKRHKGKNGYTIIIMPDSAEKNEKKFHVNMAVLSVWAFVFLLAAICYAEYTAILMHGATERSKGYAEQIAALQKSNGELSSKNEELEKQIANLNQTLAQKEAQVQKQEESIQAGADSANMPKGFPVSGAAQVKEATQRGLQPNKDWKEVIFVAAAGTNVISTGAGKVIGVLPAKNGEPAGISIDHGNGYASNYRNAGTPKVEAGSEVEQGTVLFTIEQRNVEIGYSISKDDVFLEPMEIIEIKG